MANRLTINGHTFVDEKIADGNLTLFSSVLSDSLEADECVFTLIQGTRARFITADHKRFKTAGGYQFTVDDSFDFGALKYGDEMRFEKNEAVHLFYVKEVTRMSREAYQIVGQSLIGVLTSVNYPGGVYAGETAGEIIEDIFNTAFSSLPFHYTLPPWEQKIYGWIPWGNCRDALQQVLFAIGAVVTKHTDGLPYIHYPTGGGRITVPASKVGFNGSIELGDKVSELDLIEYTFVEGGGRWEDVFDNSEEGEDAFHTRVIFDTPASEFEVEGTLEVEELGYNYAVVSGRGILSAHMYGINKKELRATVNPNVASNVATVKDCYLVSPANSFNVLARLKSYYLASESITSEIGLTEGLMLNAGDPVEIPDAFNQIREGFVRSLSEPISGIIKASAKVDCGWTPQGMGNTFDVSRRVFITEDGTFNKPEGVTVIYAALIGGGQGGENGLDGAPGGSAGDTMGGAGGDIGACGEGGKVWVSTYTVPSQALQFAVKVGASGASDLGEGGDTELRLGSELIASSADGASIATGAGWTDALTGDTYAMSGLKVERENDLHRYEGMQGGGGGSSDWHPSGYDFDEEYTGGAGGANYRGDTYFSNGGCGGGGAYGGDGYAGTNATDGYGGNGGRGADAAAGFDGIDYGYGYGGGGGHGGGGGGAGGPVTKDGTVYPNRQGTGGAGGSGGAGGLGAPGCCIIYY